MVIGSTFYQSACHDRIIQPSSFINHNEQRSAFTYISHINLSTDVDEKAAHIQVTDCFCMKQQGLHVMMDLRFMPDVALRNN